MIDYITFYRLTTLLSNSPYFCQSAGADVNQKLFRGYAVTAAAREGHCNILSVLLKAGASQAACEEALLEASNCGEAEAVHLLLCSDMPHPNAGEHALVTASSRGFIDVVTTLVKVLQDIFTPMFYYYVVCDFASYVIFTYGYYATDDCFLTNIFLSFFRMGLT